MFGRLRTYFCIGLCVTLLSMECPANAETQAEKLGFPADKKVLILHADDIGMCYEANEAAKVSLPGKHYLSCSAMAPCPWFNEFADWCKQNPQYDVGLHVTLNSEWKYYRWGSVSDPSDVPGLIDKSGYLHNSTVVTALRAKPDQVEKEIRAQFEKAIAAGFKPSHIDSHMGTVFARPDFIEAYLKVAKDYKVPAFVPAPSEKLVARLRKEGTPITPQHVELMEKHEGPKVDDFYVIGGSAKDYDEKKSQTLALIESLQPGLTQIIFHPSIETETTRQITGTARTRGWEAKLWGDPDVIKYFADNGIIQTDWRELQKRYDEHVAKTKPASP
ncbi:polysaccharide deacetylase family protein [bacterium]|nr:polysaccharide deacetylase family protein [bacterium]